MESAEKAAQTQGKASILEFVRSVLTVGSVCTKKIFFFYGCSSDKMMYVLGDCCKALGG